MLEVLRRIVQEVASARELDQALAIIVKRIKQAMAADVSSVYLADYSRRRQELKATDGLNPAAVGPVSLAMGEGVVSVVAEAAEQLNLDDAPDHPHNRIIAETGEANTTDISAYRSFIIAYCWACWWYGSASAATSPKTRWRSW